MLAGIGGWGSWNLKTDVPIETFQCPQNKLLSAQGFRPAPSGGLLSLSSNTARARRQRERAGASIGSEQPKFWRTAPRLNPPPSFPASAGQLPRSPTTARPSSGIGPERALEANNLNSGAQRQGSILPELPCERRTAPAEPHHRARRQRERAGASIGSEQPKLWRTAPRLNPPPSFPASAGPLPRSPTTARPIRLEMTDPIATPALSEQDGVA